MAPAYAQVMLAQHRPAHFARVPLRGKGVSGVVLPHHLLAGSEARCGEPGVCLGLWGTVLTGCPSSRVWPHGCGGSHCGVWSSACLGRSIPCQCCAWRSPWLFPRAALGNQPAAPRLLLLGAVSLSGTGGNNRPHHPFTVRSEDSTSPHSASSCSSAPRATAAQWCGTGSGLAAMG